MQQLSTALKQSYVYLGRKVTVGSILNRVAVMRSEGPKRLSVSAFFYSFQVYFELYYISILFIT